MFGFLWLLFSHLFYAYGAKKNERILTIVNAGDVMTHQAVIRCAQRNNKGEDNNNGFNYVFSRVKPHIEKADIATFNAEFPVPSKIRNRPRQYVFAAPVAMIRALKWAGFDVANLANNHAFDQGREGVAETISAFREVGILTVGAGYNQEEAQQFLLVESKEIKVAFIGATTLFNRNLNSKEPGDPHVNQYKLGKVVEKVKVARKVADVVILHVHWGYEGHTQPAEWQKKDAIALMEAGVDVIVGHHPHVLQPIVSYTASDGRFCVCAMSLGNLVSNQRPAYRYGSASVYGFPRDGALFYVKFEKENGRVKLVGSTALPLWTWNDRFDPDNKVKYPWNIQVLPITDALREIEGQLSGDVSQTKRRYWVTFRDDLLKRKQNIISHLGIPEEE